MLTMFNQGGVKNPLPKLGAISFMVVKQDSVNANFNFNNKI
jgi:hypothetical protein